MVALALVLTVGIYTWRERQLPSWEVDSINGVTKLRLGHWLETESSEATLRIENVGEVRVEANSKLRLLESKPQEYRMQLEQGTMHARVWAPPRLFFVNTPSVTAIDLGCAYDLSVDKSGASILQVTVGLVQLESVGRESIVPAGWSAKTRRDGGPGTPYLNETSAEMQQAIDVVDFEHDANAKAASLDLILARSTDNDLVTLWHLLPRVDAESRKRIYERMLSLTAAPEGTTVEGIVHLNPEMMNLWKPQLGLVW